jgi:hypothetical protein
MPALRRYQSERVAFVARESQRLGQPLLIFSGKYGLIDASEEIPWYDRMLEAEGVGEMVAVLRRQLREKEVTAIHFYAQPPATPGWGPYCDALTQACEQLGVAIEYRTLG